MTFPDQASVDNPESLNLPFLAPWRLSWVALVLLALYATVVLGVALPLRLMDPAWQLAVYNAMVNASAFPLMGLGLLHLSSDLDPDSLILARRARFFSRLAVPIALGFLLLIPLQSFVLWEQNRTATNGASSRLARQERTIASLRQALQQAASVSELQQRFRALQGPSLGAAEQALPLDQLKAQLNVALVQADQNLRRSRVELSKATPGSVFPLALRNGLSCLALAIGFAALGQRRRAPLPFLMEWQYALETIHLLTPWGRRHQPRALNQDVTSLVEQMSSDEDDRP